MSASRYALKAADPPAKNSATSNPLRIRNIRTQEALVRFAGDEKRYRHWLLDFIGHGPLTVASTRKAIENGDFETAKRIVHAFNGRTSMLGMSELYALTAALEMALHHGEPSAYWLADLEQTVAATCDDLRQALAPSTKG